MANLLVKYYVARSAVGDVCNRLLEKRLRDTSDSLNEDSDG